MGNKILLFLQGEHQKPNLEMPPLAAQEPTTSCWGVRPHHTDCFWMQFYFISSSLTLPSLPVFRQEHLAL